MIQTPLKASLADLTHIDVSDTTLRVKIAEQRAAKSYGVLVKGPRGKDDRLAIVLRPTALLHMPYRPNTIVLFGMVRVFISFLRCQPNPEDLKPKSRTAA